MNTSPTTTTTTCSLAIETGTEIVSSTGSKLSSIALDAAEEANDDASFVAVGASPKAKTMKEVLLRCGRAFAVLMAIALAGKGFVGHAHNDPPGTDDVMMNVNLGIGDSSKQVALLDGDGDGNNVANYDFTEVGGSGGGGMPSERSLQSTSYTFTRVGDGGCRDSSYKAFDLIGFDGIADVDACKAKCEECPGQGQAAGKELRGFYHDDANCYCYVENGGMFDKSVCNGAIVGYNLNSGTGAICNVNPPDNGECWKVCEENEECPTPAPTNKPLPTPAPTNKPTTLAPTALPTNKPTTASPTKEPTTLAPTNKPTTASPTSSPTNSKSAKVAKKVKSSKVSEVNQLGAAANM